MVSIPLETPIILPKFEDAEKMEKFFINQRDQATSHSKKVELDRARALVKYATCCNAHIVAVSNAPRKIRFSLGFSSVEYMLEFQNSMRCCIEGSTMD